MRIAIKILVGFLILSLLTGAVGIFSIVRSQENLKVSISNTAMVLAEDVLSRVHRTIYHRVEELQAYSKDLMLQEIIINTNERLSKIEGLDECIKKEKQDECAFLREKGISPTEIVNNTLSAKLREIKDFYKQKYDRYIFSQITIVNKYGFGIAQTNKKDDYCQIGNDWWQEIRGGREVFVFFANSNDNSGDNMAIDICLRIDDNSGKFIGAIKASLSVEEVDSVLKDEKSRMVELGRNFILTREGGIIICSTKNLEIGSIFNSNSLSEDDKERIVLSGEREVLIDNDNKIVFGIAKSGDFKEMDDLGLILITEYEAGEILASAAKLKKDLLKVSCAGVVVALVIGVIISYSISRPINQLAKATKSISGGDFSQKAKISSGDEIEELASSFNKMTKSLIELSSQSRTIIQSIPEILIVLNKRKRVVDINLVACNSLGCKKNRIKNIKIEKAISLLRYGNKKKRKKVNGLVSVINKMFETSKTGHIKEYELNKKIYEVFAIPIFDQKNKISGGILIMHDITHLKVVDKMKTEFVSLVSHQLKTPLTSINWNLELLLGGDSGKMSQEQKSCAKEAYQSSREMVLLINALLNVSRLETGRLEVRLEKTDLIKFLKEIVEDKKSLAKSRRCKITFKKPRFNLQKISIDRNLGEQVIGNIIDNAINYSNEEKGAVLVGVIKSKNEYIIRVEDNGIGISKKDQAKVFDKFFRAKGAKSVKTDGSGLGLYISKSIMKCIGGRIWFESKKNKGSIFYIALPSNGDKRLKRSF